MALVDAMGRCLFIFARSAKIPSDPKRVLVVRLDHLGDILPATGIPQLLKEHFAGSSVSFLTSSAGAELLKHNPFVDEVLVYDAPWFARGGRSKKGGARFWKTIREIKKKKFDLALSLRGDLRENFMVFAGGVTHRVGYGVTGGGFFLTRPLIYREGDRAHESRRTLDILRAAGVPKEVLAAHIYFSPEEEERLRADRRTKGLPDSWAVVQLKAGTESKDWPRAQAEEFTALCAEKLPRLPLLFIGDSPDGLEWLTDLLKKNPALPWKNLIGKTTLRELLWLIRQSRLFVGLDSGPSHIAASFGVPTLFLYSGTNVFEEWRSLEESAEFLRNPVPCSPCHLTECSVPGHPCMSGIEPGRVVDWISEKSRER
jgi:heptosyltransferase-3